ncbi:hypothetical protein B0J12DRAFT_665618 [Macrophomina phaseolina]|uniref:Uncharacterized protein n=1 Tax=Macrophomina phaseolina TaxID=35725 RepID=A0ABQ8G8J0_9PEZI|nr:hypothetical protein B0J12DRAFT_665618 [Macrophomina phaseolina]
MATPFPSDSSLAGATKQKAIVGPLASRKISFKAFCRKCSQLFSRRSTDASLPALERCAPLTEKAQSSTASSVKTPGETAPSSPRSRRQQSQQELRNLSDSQLGLQLALLLPEEPRAPSSRSTQMMTGCPRITARREEGLEEAIPFLDLDAVWRDDSLLTLRGGLGDEPVVGGSDERMRLWERGRDGGLGEVLERAGGYVAPRHLLRLG